MKWRIEPETIEKERNFAGGLRWGAKTAVIWGNCGLRNASPARFEREWGRRKVESLKSRVSKSEVEMEMEVAVSKMVGNARDATTNHCVPLTHCSVLLGAPDILSLSVFCFYRLWILKMPLSRVKYLIFVLLVWRFN